MTTAIEKITPLGGCKLHSPSDAPKSGRGHAETSLADKGAGSGLDGNKVMRGVLLNKGSPGISAD